MNYNAHTFPNMVLFCITVQLEKTLAYICCQCELFNLDIASFMKGTNYSYATFGSSILFCSSHDSTLTQI